MVTSPIYPWFNEFYIGQLTYPGYLLFSRLQHTNEVLEVTRLVGYNTRTGQYFWSFPAGFAPSDFNGYFTVRACFKSSRFFNLREAFFDSVIVLANDLFDRREIQYQQIKLDAPIKLIEKEGNRKILNYTYKQFEVLTGKASLKFNWDYRVDSFLGSPEKPIEYMNFNRWMIEEEFKRQEVLEERTN